MILRRSVVSAGLVIGLIGLNVSLAAAVTYTAPFISKVEETYCENNLSRLSLGVYQPENCTFVVSADKATGAASASVTLRSPRAGVWPIERDTPYAKAFSGFAIEVLLPAPVRELKVTIEAHVNEASSSVNGSDMATYAYNWTAIGVKGGAGCSCASDFPYGSVTSSYPSYGGAPASVTNKDFTWAFVVRSSTPDPIPAGKVVLHAGMVVFSSEGTYGRGGNATVQGSIDGVIKRVTVG